MIASKLARTVCALVGLAVCSAAYGQDAQDSIEVQHPLCDKTAEPCVGLTFELHGGRDWTDYDRMEAKVANVCVVALKDGTSATASTELLKLPDTEVLNFHVVNRTVRLPKGCAGWYHIRNTTGLGSHDRVVSQTILFDQDRTAVVHPIE